MKNSSHTKVVKRDFFQEKSCHYKIWWRENPNKYCPWHFKWSPTQKTFADSYIQLEAGLTALKHDLSGLKKQCRIWFSKAEAIRGLLERCNDEFSCYINDTGLKPESEGNSEPTPAHLSSREYQVFMLLVQGRKIKEVAEHLGISANTASTYRTRIMKKLGFSSLSELIHYAMRFGLS